MNSRPKRDLPVRAASSVLALLLLASVVAGREQPDVPARVEPARSNAKEDPGTARQDFDFDPATLARVRQEEEFPDLFASTAPPAPVAAAAQPVAPKPQPAAPPPAPMAPPLPFKFLGKLADADRVLVFLERNQETLAVAVGETVGNAYRIESIAEGAVHFRYLPLGITQVLSMTAQK